MAAMPIDKTSATQTPDQQIKALQVQLKQAQEKAQLFEAVIDVLRNRPDTGVLVMTERAAAEVPLLVKSLREREDPPLLVEIPDRHGSLREPDFLTRYIRNAIGVKIE